MTIIKNILKVLGVLLVVIIAFTIWLLTSMGYFRTLENPYQGTIKQIIPTVGSEDFAIGRKDSFLIVSSCNYKKIYAADREEGNLKYINLRQQPYTLETLDLGIDLPFYPHGISLLEIDSAVYQVFVVNHRQANEHTIEIFEIRGKSVKYLQTIKDEKINHPNDIVAISPTEFYVTNDRGAHSKRGKFLEALIGFRWSNAIHYKNGKTEMAASNVALANGINYNPQKKEVYIVSSRDNEVWVYGREENGELTYKASIDCNTTADNVEVDADGNLWVGGHPKLLDYLSYRGDVTGEKIAPSEVVKITTDTNGDYQAESVFVDKGNNISGTSVALPYGNQIFVGNVSYKQMLVLEN